MNSHYFTQTQRYDAWLAEQERTEDFTPIQLSTEVWDQWKTMTENVIFFDTGACLQGGHIGDANSVQFSAISTRFIDWGNSTPDYSEPTINEKGWWISTNETPSQSEYNSDGTQSGDVRGDAYDTRLSASGRVNIYEEDLYVDYLEDYITMVEDCDVECQATGSNMTAIASLMGFVYGIVGLNSLFMFIGTWRANWRVCSVFCTIATCFCTFIVLIIVATMLFTSYNAVCARSLYPAWGESVPYTMADDFYWTFFIYILTWIFMFVFACIGMCQNFTWKE